jgi:hypothetical protein
MTASSTWHYASHALRAGAALAIAIAAGIGVDVAMGATPAPIPPGGDAGVRLDIVVPLTPASPGEPLTPPPPTLSGSPARTAPATMRSSPTPPKQIGDRADARDGLAGTGGAVAGAGALAALLLATGLAARTRKRAAEAAGPPKCPAHKSSRVQKR